MLVVMLVLVIMVVGVAALVLKMAACSFAGISLTRHGPSYHGK
jgi:UPF0716 family protein affecting phage T7 exclusion